MNPRDRERLADEWLVLSAAAGDREAFRSLTERWQARLWRHARNITQRDDLAWDVTQDVWTVIVQRLGRLVDARRFGSWALSIATRRALDRLRREGREERLDRPAEVAAREERGSGDELTTDRVRAALARITPEQRALLALHHAEGFDLEDLAATLDVPVGTVKSRLYTAREALRARLERSDR